MTVLFLSLAIVVSLLVAAFCAGSETGFLSVNRGRIVHTAREGGVHAKILLDAIADLGRTTTALLVGNNLASVSFSAASAALSVQLYPASPTAQAVWSACAACVILYFGEFAPKLLCSARPLRRMLALAPFWKVFALVFVPISGVIQRMISFLLPKREVSFKVTPETVLKILQDRKDGVMLSDLESALVGRIMLLRARGQRVTPETLLQAIDETV